jgi:SAM-dependent methyltransferase
MVRTVDQLKEGHYARKQLFSRSWLISWSHGRRFAVGQRLALGLGAQRLLDYGCGDGTFLALLAEQPGAPASAVGAEVHDSLVADCRARLSGHAGLTFLTVGELDQPEWRLTFDAIICMEVLEHVVDWQPVFDRWEQVLAPGGHILISVPVETGPAVLIKEVVRRVAGWRGIGDYPGQDPYTASELVRSIFTGRRQHIPRRAHPTAGGLPPHHDHKGFNWKVLLDALTQRYTLRRMYRSPLPLLPAGLNSQVWFHLTKPLSSTLNPA